MRRELRRQRISVLIGGLSGLLNLMDKLKRNNWILFICLIIWLSFAVQWLTLGDFGDAATFMFTRPLYFLYNCLFAADLLLLFATLFGRWRYIPAALVALLYTATGVAFRIKLDYHGVGLTPSDLSLAGEALQMSDLLSSGFVIKNILLGLLVLGVSLLLAHFIRRPVRTVRRRLLEGALALVALAALILLPIWKNHVSDEYYQAEDVGAPYYFFSKTPTPSPVTSFNIERLNQQLRQDLYQYVYPYLHRAEQPETPEARPDIVVIQCESFFDFTEEMGVENFSADPLPFFHQLQQRSASGAVYSPTYGGGTSNAEFEALTGISMANFVEGTNIFASYINDPMISIGSILRNQGYYALALHPYMESFYSRTKNYRYLGFNRFDSIESMRAADPEFDERAYSYEGAEYPSDRELVHQIISNLEAQQGEDTFIFAVSVQIHIPFENYADSEYYIEYTGDQYTDPDEIKEIEGYASNLRETDAALQTLVEYLEQRDKETILVFYGDHQPRMTIYPYANEKQPEANAARHQTPVLFWSNQRDLSGAGQLALDMTAIPEQTLYLAGAELPEYLLALRQIRLEEQVESYTAYYVIIDGEYYHKGSEEYSRISKLYQLIYADTFVGDQLLEADPQRWLVEDNSDYLHQR